jgi:hypothetical protein
MLSSRVSTVNGAWIPGIEWTTPDRPIRKTMTVEFPFSPKVGIVYTSDLLSTAVRILNYCHSEAIDTGPVA